MNSSFGQRHESGTEIIVAAVRAAPLFHGERPWTPYGHTSIIAPLFRAAPVAQLDRASASGAEGCGFDPRRARRYTEQQYLRSPAEMCGNGARCVSRFAFLEGIAGEKLAFHTDVGVVSAACDKPVNAFGNSAAGVRIDWDDFAAKYEDLKQESAKLAEVAAGGDKAAIAARDHHHPRGHSAAGGRGRGCHLHGIGPEAQHSADADQPY